MENFQQSNEIPNTDIHTNEISKDTSTVSIDLNKIFEWGLYAFGGVLLIISMVYLFDDLELRSSGDVYKFKEVSYVGGDAYNFIISAARSGAVMTKSLIFAVLGCSSIIVGKLTAIVHKLK